MTENRINAYHIMWMFVFFDLPVATKKQRKAATRFRKALIRDGFTMMQFSVYIRHCASRESYLTHLHDLEQMLCCPGQVDILAVTDKQYGDMHCYFVAPNPKESNIFEKVIPQPVQLELF